MHITLDTNDLSSTDVKMLAVLAGVTSDTPSDKPAKSAAKKSAPKREAAREDSPADPEPEVDETTPEPDEDSSGEADMATAVELATKMVSNGEAAKVKEALAEVGAKRVSELKEEDIPTFVASLN